MQSRQYYLLNNTPGQPFADIRCYIVQDGPVAVLVRCSDIRLTNCPESMALKANLTPCPSDTEELRSAKGGLVNFSSSLWALAFCLVATSLAACGVDTSKLNNSSTLKDQGTDTATSTATATSTGTADPRQGQTTVEVQTQTTVKVTTGAASAPVVAPGSGSANSTLLTFADQAYGWFFADGSFDRGAVLVAGQKAPGYCRFEAPDCEGRCIIDSLPAKNSLFTNGTAYFRAWETETDLGRTVVASIWQGGHCAAAVKTLDHAYSPTHAWTLDPGDSTIPSKHQNN